MFAAEPPQEPLPYGRWAEALGGAVRRRRARGHRDRRRRTSRGSPSAPGTAAPTCPPPSPAGDGEVFGYVSYTREHEGAQAADFAATADFTEETAEQNPDWTLDLSDEEIGQWRGTEGRRGVVTLVWGVALVPNGVVATAELGPTTTDQCELVDDRFTLVSVDAYTGDYVEVRLYGARGAELARESLYEDE